MGKFNITKYVADANEPLIVSFSNFLREYGLSTRVEYEFWDLLGYGETDSPEIAVLIRRNRLSPNEIFRLTEKIAPQKVVLLEGDEIPWDDIDSMRLFCAAIGVSLYIRNIGWVVSLTKAMLEREEDWHFKVLDRYSQDEHGNWGKFCTKCGVWQPTWGFYKRGSKDRNAKDPYRNICKDCSYRAWRDGQARRRRAKRKRAKT